MTPATRLEAEFSSNTRELPAARQRFQNWLLELGWSEPRIGELVLALDEAMTNVIRHGYHGECTHRIHVCVEQIQDAQRGDGVEVRIRDHGEQIDPQKICGRELDQVRPGGLGVHIIRQMTDHAEYTRADGGGMLLTLRKFREAPGPAHSAKEPT